MNTEEIIASAAADLAAKDAALLRLREAARELAVLGLQTNEYHRTNMDFRDAVDNVLALTRD